MIKSTLIALLVSCCWSFAQAQWPMATATYYGDSYREWEIFDADYENIGNLRSIWDMGDRQLKDWSYDIDGVSGQIRLKSTSDLNIWELFAEGFLFTARTKWTDDFSEWQITGHNYAITIRAQNLVTREEWETVKSNIGAFNMYTTQEGDLRDWSTTDEIDEKVTPHLKFFLMFIVIFNSTMVR